MVVGLKTNDVANVGFFEKKVLFKGANFFGHFNHVNFTWFFFVSYSPPQTVEIMSRKILRLD
jgi:hypothetical protein